MQAVLAIPVMVLDTAHVVSPMIVAWSQPGLRTIVRREWIKHLAIPTCVMIGVAFVPFAWLSIVYWTWNAFHFGMQNFGVMALCGRRGMGKIFLWFTMLSLLLLPAYAPNSTLVIWLLGAFSLTHWLTDIGLSSRVVRWHWWFVAGVLAMGVLWLLLRNGPLSVRIVPEIIAIRYGIGIIHFIYSARIWKMSDPEVRASIGKELFA